tara:strand:- start:15 stop:809 length:795 start_codon:yes stop_codon:yes gene_type:complete
MFTDSHTHLYLEQFENDLDSVIQEAINKKITRFLLPNIDNETITKLISICKKYNDVLFPMIGLHPCSVDKNYKQQIEKLYSHMNDIKFIGIGEVGIDLYWDKQFIREQQDALSMQINFSKQYNLPIIIHSRNSFNEIYDILHKEVAPNTAGIFHCFSGTYEQAKKIIDLGFYIGIGGLLTFKNSNLPKIIKNIDLRHIVLETDAPYLAPHPMRGKRNEPKFLYIIAETLGQIKGVSTEKIAAITNQNIDNIFFDKINKRATTTT